MRQLLFLLSMPFLALRSAGLPLGEPAPEWGADLGSGAPLLERVLTALIYGFVAILGLAAIAMVGLIMTGLLVMPAQAQAAAAAASTTFDFGPFASAVIEFLAPALLSLVGLIGAFVLTQISAWLRTKMDASKAEAIERALRIDESQRGAIDQALQRAVGFAIDAVGDKARGGIPVDLRYEAVVSAAGYAQRSIPDALAHFKVTPQRLEEMVAARLEGLIYDPAVPESEMAISPVAMRLSR